MDAVDTWLDAEDRCYGTDARKTRLRAIWENPLCDVDAQDSAQRVTVASQDSNHDK